MAQVVHGIHHVGPGVHGHYAVQQSGHEGGAPLNGHVAHNPVQAVRGGVVVHGEVVHGEEVHGEEVRAAGVHAWEVHAVGPCKQL